MEKGFKKSRKLVERTRGNIHRQDQLKKVLITGDSMLTGYQERVGVRNIILQ